MRIKLGIQLRLELTCALASDLNTSYPTSRVGLCRLVLHRGLLGGSSTDQETQRASEWKVSALLHLKQAVIWR